MMTPRDSRLSASESLEADPGFLAFQYIAGELTEAEAAAFEERLAVDQAAREAVARAVEVAQAVTVLGPLAPQALPVGRPRRVEDGRTDSRSPRRAALVSVVAAAAVCVALAVAFNPFSGSQPAGDGQAENSERSSGDGDRPAPRQNAARLVELWSDTDGLFVPDAAAFESLTSVWSEESSSSENGDSEFAWMLTAVSAELPAADTDAPALSPQHPLSPQTREN
jgi:hypothetical protein